MTLKWDDVKEGQALPEIRKAPGVTQLVKYAAGSGDFNPLHHDYAFPQAKQLGSIIVHGRFKYASLGELVSNWLGHAGRIRKISCQYRGMDFPDKGMTCGGVVKRKPCGTSGGVMAASIPAPVPHAKHPSRRMKQV